ncbi:MAG: Crp/Fnr family transcriptional regulator [Bacteroidales bacterium]|nr:Crp/Fnr family transcriptional regulator [Bacteroidales bacterium]
MSKTFKEPDCNQCKDRIEVFKVLNEEDLKKIDKIRYDVLFHAGEIIFKQGTPFTHTICILEGLAKVYLEAGSKRRFILTLIGPGEMIGSPGMFIDGLHHFSVAAVDDSVACFVQREIIEGIISTNNRFATELLKRANKRDIQNFQRFLSLTRKQAPGRLAETLLFLYHEIYKTNPFKITISRQDLADMSATTKENTIRTLKIFKEEGLISMTGNLVTILNKRLLQSVSVNG